MRRVDRQSRSFVVVVSGLPATGKTSLAMGLAEHIGAVVLSRDQARREVGGRLVVVDRLFSRVSGRHRRGLQRRAAGRLEEAVYRELAQGRRVVVELVADQAAREGLQAVAAEHAVPVFTIEVACSDPVEFARRLGGRRENWHRIFDRLSKSYEPAADALVVDSRMPPNQTVDEVVTHICRTVNP